MKRQLILLIAFCVATFISGFSQSCPTFTSFSGVLQGTTQVTFGNTINFPVTSKAGTSILREKNKSAKLYFKLDLGNDYIKQNLSTWKFKVTVDLTYKFSLPGAVAVVKTLTITDAAPEMLKIEDALSSFATSSPAFGSTVNIVAITDGTNTLSGTGLLQNFIFNNLRLKVELAREYEVDVRFASNAKMSNQLIVHTPSISNRLVTFSWQPNASNPYPNYEVQILKLFNTDPLYNNDLNQIGAQIDWSKALNIETQSCRTFVNITMGEGTGYYIWRVRPIGNYFPGGISNSENYGEWSATGSASTSTINLNKMTLNPTSPSLPYAFYFTDPDQDLNWIYSRVFTEGDIYDQNNPTGVKSSEGMSYADGLLRIRQNQKYNSSENINIVSQTVNDYSGRPALTAIPVPTAGGLTGYKTALVQDASGTLYTAKNFDTDANINDPAQVKAAGTAYSYYSGGTSSVTSLVDNANVPSAEGYPFKRTIFKTDGTNRVEEESGVGKTHSIGSQTNDRGRTTRIYYSTPSEDELIRIFGEEAPLSQSVIKTTTIDQNNVISISYTSKEGKTIATALSSPSVSNLSSVSTSTAITVNNAINQNIYSAGKIVASKRITISANSTTLNLSHYTYNMPGDNSGCIVASCNYKLRIYMKDVKNNITYVSDANTGQVGINDFTTISGTSVNFTNYAWAFVDIAGAQPNIIPSGASNNQISVNAGEYLFIKELYSSNAPGYGETLGNEDNEATRPIFDAIANRMKEIDSPLKKADFDTWMVTLRTLVTNYNAAPQTNHAALTVGLLTHLCISPTLVKPGFLFPLADKFNLSASTTNTTDPSMDNLEITTTCCGSISAQVPKSSLCIACEGSPEAAFQPTPATVSSMISANAAATATQITPYGFLDFKNGTGWSSLSDNAKQSAIQSLVEREFILPLKEKMSEESIPLTDLWKIAPGFSFESLNFMISNMLISQYYTGSAIKSGSVWYESSVNSGGGYNLGNAVTAGNSTLYPYNYDCKKVYSAWMASMASLGGVAMENSSDNPIKGYDDSPSNGPGLSLLETLDKDNWPPALKKITEKITKVIKRVFNKASNTKEIVVTKDRLESAAGIIRFFMDKAGYQFAAIVDGTPLPSYISSSVSAVLPRDYNDFVPASTPTPATIYTTITTGTITNNYVPVLFTMNGSSVVMGTVTCNSTTYNELYYPYILKPEWMFKYFVYNVFENKGSSAGAINFINDDDYLLPNQIYMDLNHCYNPPFSYLTSTTASGLTASNLCFQPVSSSFTVGSTPTAFTYAHENWTSRERFAFYDEVQGGPRCFESKGISVIDTYYDLNTVPDPPTKVELFAMANDEMTERINGFTNRAEDIKAALINELEKACYVIVPCKSSTPLPEEVTLKEVDLMVAAVINTMVAELMIIKSNFTVSPSATITPCSTMSSLQQSYTPVSSCNLPACVVTDCKEIILYENNTLGLTDSRKIDVVLFKDCDQKILDMLESGSFLPYIEPINGCINQKTWKACTTNSCERYGEKVNCSSAEFERHSKEYNVTATGTN